MSNKTKISVVISAFNEEKKIEDCLKSVENLADEIIVVDNKSLDKTADIVKKYKAKVFEKENNLMLNINKNYGFSKATNDWILYLDADERISKELAEEIGNWKLEIGNSRVSGFWIPRKNIIFGKWIKHAGWYPDYQLRLFKREKGKFPEEHVHEMIKVDGESAHLKNHMIHQNFEALSQFLHKHIDIYAPNEAEQLLRKGYRFKWQDAINMPIKEFLSRFFAREGYRDGLHGLIISMLMSFYHFIIFTNIWERQEFKEIEYKDLLTETEKEIKTVNREMKFWFLNERLKKIRNPFKKILYQILKRVI